MIFGFSSKYWLTSPSSNPSIILTDYAYKGMESFFVATFSWVETLILVLPFRKVRVFFRQFCWCLLSIAMAVPGVEGKLLVLLILKGLLKFEMCNHQLLYLTAELDPMVERYLWPPFLTRMDTFPIWFRVNHMFACLMTFNPEPPSTILPDTSWPLMMTLMLGLCYPLLSVLVSDS